jgi:PhnB protein
MRSAKPIPEGISILTPMLVCRDAEAEMDFCTAVFGASELNRRLGPDGSVAHGLVAIGGATVMIEGEWEGIVSQPPRPDGSSPVVLYVYVEDVDSVVQRATAAGATVLMEVEDRFWGDRTGRIVDPAGHVWTISTRIEETTTEERERRWSDITQAAESSGSDPTDAV